MQLERAEAELRPLSPWRAIDFGFAMARRWWVPLMTAWCAVVLPVQLLLYGIAELFPDDDVTGEEGVVVIALLYTSWWIRPLFDRVLLFVLSRRLFGGAPTVAEVIAATRTMWRTDLFSALVWRRLDPARSFLAPIVDLEAQKGADLRARRHLIKRRGVTEAGWLTGTMVVFELLMQLCVVALLAWVWPNDPATEMGRWAASPFDMDEVTAAVMNLWIYSGIFAVAVVEPFYVAAGFGLYLARRANLEGWDIEVQFRSMNRRLSASAAGPDTRRSSARAGFIALLVTISMALVPSNAGAEIAEHGDVTEVALTEGSSPVQVRAEQLDAANKEAIDAAVAKLRKDFRLGETEKKSGWRSRFKGSDGGSGFFSLLSHLLGPLVSWTLWIALAVAVALILRRALSTPLDLSRSSLDQDGDVVQPARSAGEVAGPPPSVAHARQLIHDGQLDLGISALYRAVVEEVTRRNGAVLGRDATEYECVRIARSHEPKRAAEYVREVALVWQHVAYADRLPDAQTALALCDRWADAWGGHA